MSMADPEEFAPDSADITYRTHSWLQEQQSTATGKAKYTPALTELRKR